jgi:Fic family protein
MARWNINFDYRIDINNEIVECLIQAESHRRITARIPLPPKMAEEIDKINIIRQIKGTTGLEGNPLTEQEIEKIVNASDEGIETSNTFDKEVKNAYEVQNFIRKIGRSKSEKLVITEDLVKQLHYISTKDIQSKTNEPGKYRNCSVNVGDYYPPNPEEISTLMNDLMNKINEPSLINGSSPLLRAVIAHFYLISIHPFGDGNGRTSRALEAYILYNSGFNTRGFYSLANFFYRNREQYINELQAARFEFNANLTSFVQFALRGFVEEITDVQETILMFVRRTLFTSYIEDLLTVGELTIRSAGVMRLLIDAEELTIQQFKEKKHPIIRAMYEKVKTDRTVIRDLSQLKQQNLIVLMPGGKIRPNMSVMDQFEG